MSVRKRTWTTPAGEKRTAWQADYVDAAGVRRRKAFERKKDADDFLTTAKTEVKAGVHVPDTETITIEEAGKLWMKSGAAADLERTTMDQRRQHLDLHIVPFAGSTKLNKLSVPWVRSFQDKLREAGRSADMVRRVTVSLGSIVADAQARGLTVRNPIHEMARSRSQTAQTKRAKPKLVVGVDIPDPDEMKAFLAAIDGRWRPLFLTLTFTGMRSSELRGLTWSAVDFDAKLIHVRQRADAYNAIGRPKSEAGDRSIPVPPMVINALKEWKLACPRRDTGKKDEAGNPITVLEYVFPNGAGRIESHANIVNRGLVPAMIAAGVSVDTGERDEHGKPIRAAKYTGLHALRHFHASWCIAPAAQGGQGLLPKVVQERMGHSSIAMTMDTYGHLFPKGDDGDALEMAAARLLS
jgi:integrase